MMATGLTATDEHTDWLNHSPAARALARHGVDWSTEPRAPLSIAWTPEDLPADDMKIRPAIALYGGTLEVDATGTQIVHFESVPPAFADTLLWDQDDCCGWWILE